MIRRNVYFVISLVTNLSLALYLIRLISGAESIIKIIIIVSAVIISFINVSPRFKKKQQDIQNDDYSNADDYNYNEEYLILSDGMNNYQFFVYNSMFIFKRLKRFEDAIDVSSFSISSLDKHDKTIPFGNVKEVIFNDIDEFMQSGELIFRYDKRASYSIVGWVKQEVIDSYFRDVKYKKKNYKEKKEDSKYHYAYKKRLTLANLSYLSKLMIPFSVFFTIFYDVIDKPKIYYIGSVIGIVGFVIAAYISVEHMMIVATNEKNEKDDIDVIGSGILMGIIFAGFIIEQIIVTNFENPIYSWLLIGMPALIITLVLFFRKMPSAEIEKIYRAFSVAIVVIISIVFVNSLDYKEVRIEEGIVVSAYHDNDVNSFEVMKSNGEIFTLDGGNFEENEKIKVEYKKGLLGMKIFSAKSMK